MFGSNRAFKRNNRLLSVLLLTACLLFVSGCTQKANTPEMPSDNPPLSTSVSETPAAVPPPESDPLQPAPEPDLTKFTTLLNPSKFETLYLNPITFTLSQKDVPGTLWLSTFIIDGLKDESIQAVINKDLTNLYEAMERADLPPYRGIYQRIPPGLQPTSMSLSANAAFNFDNLLSVAVYADKTYTINDTTGERSEFSKADRAIFWP